MILIAKRWSALSESYTVAMLKVNILMVLGKDQKAN